MASPAGGATAAKQETERGDGEFEFSRQLERADISVADDIFFDGKIKPLVEPATMIFSLRDSVKRRNERKKHEREISREGKGGNGLVSPLRVCDILVNDQAEFSEPSPSIVCGRSKLLSSKSFSFPSLYKKWKLKDFYLFGGSSEWHSPKYSVLSKKGKERDEKSLSFLSSESVGSAVEGRRGRVATEVRWKTALPYKHGLLAGCLGFNLPVIDDMVKHKSVER